MVGLRGILALGAALVAAAIASGCTFDGAGARGGGAGGDADAAPSTSDARPGDPDGGGALDAGGGTPDAALRPDARPEDPCPTDDPWELHGDSCYLLFEPADWITGKVNCDLVGAKLVSITSLAEYEAIRDDFLEGADFEIWIGLSDILIEGRFMWEDGSPLDFTAWTGGEPNNAGGVEDCVEFRFLELSGVDGWNDQECSDERNFVCERPRAD